MATVRRSTVSDTLRGSGFFGGASSDGIEPYNGLECAVWSALAALRVCVNSDEKMSDWSKPGFRRIGCKTTKNTPVLKNSSDWSKVQVVKEHLTQKIHIGSKYLKMTLFHLKTKSLANHWLAFLKECGNETENSAFCKPMLTTGKNAHGANNVSLFLYNMVLA